ncbi:MAG TPA: Gfo/Idh/MocA family oxidoreductase [archaeon]|nr:Gfo/Idh/MocA family oxidoreductase [archaeon]
MKKLKAGIIGLGVGEQHIAGYEKHPHCEVVALCDFSEEKIELARKKYPHLKAVSRAEELLEDGEIDVVSVASYDNYHFEQVERALKNGKHVFAEKPLCLYEYQAERIRSLLLQNPALKISSNLILRMSPRFRLLREMVGNGDLGVLFYVEGDYNYGRLQKITEGWRGKIDFYSVVHGGAIHIIDLLLWITGDKVVEVSAYGNNIVTQDTGFRYNDLVACLLKFQSGMVGKVTTNFGCVYPHFHNLSLYGTKATFQNAFDYGMLFEKRDPERDFRKITALYKPAHKGDLIYSFIESILKGSPAEVTVEDIFQTMSVCLAIEKSAQKQKSLKVKYF